MNDLWKPQPGDVPAKQKKAKKIRAKEARRIRKHEKYLKGKREKYEAREFCIKHMMLNKYATNIAICYAISIKYELPMPDNDKEVNRFLIRLWKEKNGEFAKSRVRYKTAEEFYGSKKWREVRYIALSNSEGCCNLCGASAKDGVQLHVDHIVPRSINPKLEYDLGNLQVLCQDCNLGKSNYDSKDWR